MHDRLIYWYPGARSNPYRTPINTAWLERFCTRREELKCLFRSMRHVGRARGVFTLRFFFEPQGKAHCQIRNTLLYAYLTTLNVYVYAGWFKKMDSISHVYISWTIHGMWMIYITFERWGPKLSNITARALAYCTAVLQRQLSAKWLLCSTIFFLRSWVH